MFLVFWISHFLCKLRIFREAYLVIKENFLQKMSHFSLYIDTFHSVKVIPTRFPCKFSMNIHVHMFWVLQWKCLTDLSIEWKTGCGSENREFPGSVSYVISFVSQWLDMDKSTNSSFLLYTCNAQEQDRCVSKICWNFDLYQYGQYLCIFGANMAVLRSVKGWRQILAERQLIMAWENIWGLSRLIWGLVGQIWSLLRLVWCLVRLILGAWFGPWVG